MKFLDSFLLPTEEQEAGYLLSYPYKLEMACFTDNVYPFKLFPAKGLQRLSFAPITIFYGGNGSGKSTLLNLLAQKLGVTRSAPFNNTPFFEEYLRFCQVELTFGNHVPRESRIITSDDVFDFLLDIRAINAGIDGRREELFAEYDRLKDPDNPAILRSFDDYEAFKQHVEVKRKSKSRFVARRIPHELAGHSNGESAFSYFTHEIQEQALYLLDEPENSLSAARQIELARFLEESVRFYGCQLIISTHSPFLLAMREAIIYDLDRLPVSQAMWTELENVRAYHDFFEAHRKEFPRK